jgi:hypothetical protein
MIAYSIESLDCYNYILGREVEKLFLFLLHHTFCSVDDTVKLVYFEISLYFELV